LVAQPLARGEAVMDVAEQSSIASSRLAAVHAHVDVIELDADPGAADPTRVDGPLAAPAVALPDFAPDGCREVSRAGRGLPRRFDQGSGVHAMRLGMIREPSVLVAAALLACAAHHGGAGAPPAAERFTWVEGKAGRLRVSDGGAGGIPVVLVHGLGSDLAVWRAQLDHLRAGRRAIAYDQRGHGRSEKARDLETAR
jgi:hypothetical protein